MNFLIMYPHKETENKWRNQLYFSQCLQLQLPSNTQETKKEKKPINVRILSYISKVQGTLLHFSYNNALKATAKHLKHHNQTPDTF